VVAHGAINESMLKRLCRERLGAEYVPQRIVRIDVLPRNAGGKVMRSELVARLKFAKEDGPAAGGDVGVEGGISSEGPGNVRSS